MFVHDFLASPQSLDKQFFIYSDRVSLPTLQVLSEKDHIEYFLARSFRISKSYSTVRSYKVALNKFKKFLKENHDLNVKQLIFSLENKTLNPYEILDQYYSYLSECKSSSNTVIHYVTTAKEFLNANNMHIYSEDLKHKFRLPRKPHTYEEGLTREIITRVLHNSSQKLQTTILIACSSGVRIGELVQLRLSDVDFSTTPTTIKIRWQTCKTRQTRFTHITEEATNALKDYLRKSLGWDENTKDRYIFMNIADDENSKLYFNAVLSAKTNLQKMLRSTVEGIPELAIKNENGMNSVHFHAFRKWFKTQVTTVGQSDFAESLMGHMSIKLVYYLQNKEQRLKTYLKVEPELTITDFTKIEKTMDDMKEKIDVLSTDLEKSNEENNLLKNEIGGIRKTQILKDLETRKTIIRILKQQKVIP